MAGNSQRRGAGHKGKSTAAGSGGRIRRSLQGKGPTPKAEDRVYHKAHRAKQAAERRRQAKPTQRKATGADWVIGRNPVLEALLAGLPIKRLLVAEGAEHDDRLRDIFKFAADHGISLLQVPRGELDRLTGGLAHQGVALQVPEFSYADDADVLAAALTAERGLVVALDGITDPRNLGAIVRSAAAFGAQGIIIPKRRSAAMTATAWKTSAGAAARLPVALTSNLNQLLNRATKQGFTVVGLAGEAELPISAVAADEPLVVVVGSEGDGLARLVRENCDALVTIPINSQVESLNASVAAAIALYEISQLRATAG